MRWMQKAENMTCLEQSDAKSRAWRKVGKASRAKCASDAMVASKRASMQCFPRKPRKMRVRCVSSFIRWGLQSWEENMPSLASETCARCDASDGRREGYECEVSSFIRCKNPSLEIFPSIAIEACRRCDACDGSRVRCECNMRCFRWKVRRMQNVSCVELHQMQKA